MENWHFWAEPAIRYWYQKGVVLVPIRQRQSGTGTIKVVSVPIHQKRVGTITDQRGTCTDASSNLDFYILALLSPKFVHR